MKAQSEPTAGGFKRVFNDFLTFPAPKAWFGQPPASLATFFCHPPRG
jgi:hypothetical protein